MAAIDSSISRLIDSFISDDAVRHPGTETVILCGSFATGRATAHSDIDLCLIGDFPGFKRQSVLYEEREFQLMIAPWSWYEHVINEYERQDGNVATITVMLAEGVCLKGDSDAWKLLRQTAIRFYNAGPRPLSAAAVRAIRIRLTEAWHDFVDAEDERERNWLGCELIRLCVEAYFARRGWWAVKRKYELTHLMVRDTDMYRLLAECIDAPGSGESQERLCGYVLGPVGGWLKRTDEPAGSN